MISQPALKFRTGALMNRIFELIKKCLILFSVADILLLTEFSVRTEAGYGEQEKGINVHTVNFQPCINTEKSQDPVS